MKNKYLFDDLNIAILRELRIDSRLSYRKLASKLGVSVVTIIDRIRKMEKEKIISGYTALVDPLKLGYEFMGIVQVTISHGALLETQKKISNLSGVIGVYDVTGKYDSFVLIACKSRSGFSRLVKKILGFPKVQRTNTSIILNVFKDPSKSLF